MAEATTRTAASSAPAQNSQVKSATRTLDIIEYVVAHDRLRDAARMFRVDRMKRVVLLDEEFDPKPPSWFSEYLEPCPKMS